VEQEIIHTRISLNSTDYCIRDWRNASDTPGSNLIYCNRFIVFVPHWLPNLIPQYALSFYLLRPEGFHVCNCGTIRGLQVSILIPLFLHTTLHLEDRDLDCYIKMLVSSNMDPSLLTIPTWWFVSNWIFVYPTTSPLFYIITAHFLCIDYERL